MNESTVAALPHFDAVEALYTVCESHAEEPWEAATDSVLWIGLAGWLVRPN